MQLKKAIGVCYQTAWLLLHKLRKVMADRDRGYKLNGLVEAGEGYAGGREEGPGRSGRGAQSKSVVVVAVEQRGPGKPGKKPIPGFAALEVIPDAAAATLEGFLKAKVRPGSHILADGWNGYKRLKKNGFVHTATAISGQDEPAHSLFP